MDEEWDAEPQEVPIPPSAGANKWEGEDEEEEVKESWEDEEEEEKKDVEKQEAQKTTQPKKPKKIRAEKIEEKERKLQEELEKKAKLKEQEEEEELTPAELQADKLRQQKLQEEADLLVAMETFGTTESSSGYGIDAMNPATEEEFSELEKALTKKISHFSKSPHFPVFAEELIRNVCVNLSSNDLKKLKTTIENMFLEKSKIEKGEKSKKNKGKGKVKLRVEGENSLVNEYYNEYDEFDDFM